MNKLKIFIPNFLTALRVINTPLIIAYFVSNKYDIALIIAILTAIAEDM